MSAVDMPCQPLSIQHAQVDRGNIGTKGRQEAREEHDTGAAIGGRAQGGKQEVGQVRNATLADYRWLYANGYMQDGLKCARAIFGDIVERCPATFLDYGCGRGDLVRFINEKTRGHAIGWDPHTGESFPGGFPDWLISCDVLEHVKPSEVDATLRVFGAKSAKGLLLTIANMSDVHKVNGEDVELHLIQEPMSWWTDKLAEHFPKAQIKGRAIDASRFAIVVEF